MIIVRPYDRLLVKHSPFACGEEVLDRWLKEQAGQKERRDSTRTLLAVDEKEVRVAGYVTTTTYEVTPGDAHAAVGRRVAYPVPAVLIARLAVDLDYQGAGMGRLLLFETLERLERASHDIGSSWWSSTRSTRTPPASTSSTGFGASETTSSSCS